MLGTRSFIEGTVDLNEANTDEQTTSMEKLV